MSNRDRFDICIIGAGVVGLASAYELAKKFSKRNISIVVLEQEPSFGQHTSSRNSEVIHAGIYYPEASLKAKLCVAGKELLYAHCTQFDIPHKKIGKLIIAQHSEISALEKIHSGAASNGVMDLQFLDKAQLKKFEPEISAEAALLSPSTGIIDSHSYMQSLLHLAENLGVQFSPFSRVQKILARYEGFTVECLLDENRMPEAYAFDCSYLINAAGLRAQEIAKTIDAMPAEAIPTLYYCKGDYFDYRGTNPFKHLIYPMPEANTAGLGVHATIDLASQLKFGPDTEYVDQAKFEIEVNKAEVFAKGIASYFPAIKAVDLKPAYAGIRPKLAGPGESPADFVIQEHCVHGLHGLTQLFGIESPGLTASLAIARRITEGIAI